jgi:hypothetical protein
MDYLTRSRIQMFGVWCAIGYLAALFVGWGAVAGFLPPPAPSTDSVQIAALYGEDFTRIRIGMLLVMFAALVFMPIAAVTAQYIARIEGGASVLTYIFLLGAAGNVALTLYPAMWWLTAAFRPDRSADLLLLLNDAAWLQFLGAISVFLAMPLSVAVASLCDKSADPVFPRWCAYASVFTVLTIVPDQLLFFFKDGPFAWNGLFGIWVPATAFGVFFIIMFVVLRRAVLRERSRIVSSPVPQPEDVVSGQAL